MSVCFFVPADQAGSSNVSEEVDGDIIEENASAESPQQSLQQFWCKVTDDIKKVNSVICNQVNQGAEFFCTWHEDRGVVLPGNGLWRSDRQSLDVKYWYSAASGETGSRTYHSLEKARQMMIKMKDDFKSQALPLARIKKIMKLDEEVKMISAEAPVLFAKAAEIFIHELTLRAWAHTEDNKRRTLQRNDIAMAISKCDQFDFLIDIVPRHEVKPNKPRYDHAPRSNHADQVAHHQAAMQNATQTSQPQIVIQPCAQVVQQAATASTSTSSNNVVSQQPVTLVQQVVTPSGELQQLPIQLTQAQLNMIRLQVQNNPNQPIIIQAQSQQSPQIIQVQSQAQHQPQQQVFLAQVATSQEDS